jgi:enoyl-CoA hydratase/carnithine racemase
MPEATMVALKIEGAIATIRLGRPPMNALCDQLQSELAAAVSRVTADPAVRAVVLYGGERVFAAGADIKEMATLGPIEALARAARLQETFDAVAAIPQPVIAAITGFALGGGLELALCADFRICARNARLGQPEIQLGVIPGGGGTQRLTRLIGPARAKHIIFTGRFVDADEALQYGLVDEVVTDDDVYDAAVRLASSFVDGPALALRAAKHAIDRSADAGLAAGLELERLHFAALFATADQKTGMRSFISDGPGNARFVGE